MRRKLPRIGLCDIATVAAGFYIGYQEGKGVDVRPSVEHLAKYGPTVFALITTPLLLKTAYGITSLMHKWTKRGLQRGDLKVSLPSGKTVPIHTLPLEERLEWERKIMPKLHKMRSNIENRGYLKPTVKAGSRRAIETLIGYTAGRVYSQIN